MLTLISDLGSAQHILAGKYWQGVPSIQTCRQSMKCPVQFKWWSDKHAKLSWYSVTRHCRTEDLPLLQSSCCDDFLTLVMLPLKQAWTLFSCCDDCLTLVMLPLKQAWALLLKLHEYLADVCYKLVILQNIAWLFQWNNKWLQSAI